MTDRTEPTINGNGETPERPYIASISVTSGVPGTAVTITGAHFTGVGRAVFFQLQEPAAPRVRAPVSGWTGERVVATVPALADLGSGGTASVVVSAVGGESDPETFTVLEPSSPAIGNVTPSFVLPDDQFVIWGQGFGMAPFGGTVTVTPAGGSAVTVPVREWSANRIVTTAPYFRQGAVAAVVRVSTLWGTSTGWPLGVGEDPALPPWPVALLPARIETRFAANGTQLLLRIFPDDCAVDTHEPELTPDERAAAVAYRATTGAARDTAWRNLVARFGPGRAEWLARALAGTDPGDRTGLWTRAPATRVMPKHWYAFGYKGETRVFVAWGKEVPADLPTGPDPRASAPGSVVDDGMRWMVDFDVAVERGMAMRIDLPPEARGRLDRVVVVGVKRVRGDISAADNLAALLTAHRYTRGLAFLPEGTPTNNRRHRPAAFDSGAVPVAVASELPPVPAPGTNGAITAQAFGFDARTFGGIQHAGSGRELNDGRRAMNTVLWPSTLGYFLEQLMAPVLSPAALGRARTLFVDHVRACGPLPVLRIGNQPYGVVLATPLGHLEASDELAGLVDFLQRARSLWRASLPHVPRVGRPGVTDHSQNLLATLAVQPLSRLDRVRTAVGPDYVGAAWRFLREPLSPTWWEAQSSSARQALTDLGLPWQPRLAGATYTSEFFDYSGPRVQREQAAPGARLTADYLTWLATAPSYRSVRDESLPELSLLPPPRPMLYLLARHSLLLEYLTAATSLAPPSPPWREQELVAVDEVDDEETTPRLPTPWDRLAGGKGRALDDPAAPGLRPIRDALMTLAGLPVESLERLLAETLDLCSHRLDGWVTALASRRLVAARGTSSRGLHVGGWGAVFDVEPGQNRAASHGFIQAPSMVHASAAAVLASGYLAHQPSSARHPLAVDLSSARVRAAFRLLEGVAQGQSLATLLGYRFERALHDRGLAGYIHRFRAFAPVHPEDGGPSPDPVEGLPVRNLVDGLELQRRWVAAGRVLQSGWPGYYTVEGPALKRELDALDDAVDAVGDLLMAEGVFHAVSGNPTRAAAAFDAAGGQAAPPTEIEAVRTPRTGITITNRLLVLAPASPPVLAGSPSAASPRRAAEPRLDALAAALLANPAHVTCRVEYLDPIDLGVVASHTFKLADVVPALSALDVLFGAEAPHEGQASELEQRVRYHAARSRPANVPAAADVRVSSVPPASGSSDVGFAELLEVARAGRELLAGGRPLAPADLALPERRPASTIDVDEISRRATTAVAALRAARQGLVTASGQGPEELRAALLSAAWFGVVGAIPSSAIGADAGRLEELRRQAATVEAELGRRDSAVAALLAAPPAAGDPEGGRDHASALLAAVFGPAFRAVPSFILNVPEDELRLDFGTEPSTDLAGDQQAISMWFHQVARVREGARRLGDALTYAEALSGHDALGLRVAQLPMKAGDRWIALPFGAGGPPAGRVSLVAWAPFATPPPGGPFAGLLLDQWAEVVPSATETTSVAFHFDRPDACAPQAIVLAVPPSWDSWSMSMLVATVTQTLDMAQARAVDLDALQKAGHFLPAIHLALNVRGATVATDLRAGTGFGVR